MNASFRNCSFNELVNAGRHRQIVTSALSINWKLVHISELVGTYAYIQLIEVLKVLVMFLQCNGSVVFICVRGVQRSLFVQTALMCQSYRHRLCYILKPWIPYSWWQIWVSFCLLKVCIRSQYIAQTYIHTFEYL